MRIISGLYKNRRINFNRINIRPTTDFAKESLFNLLNNYHDLNQVEVLDLFAGSGNISYEFISRGVEKITAIDNNVKCVDFMKKIKAQLLMKNLDIKLAKSIYYLQKTKQKYDVIFADPPYNYTQEKYDQILNAIFENNILNKNATVIIEHSKFINFDNYAHFYIKRKYGKVNFTFLKNEE